MKKITIKMNAATVQDLSGHGQQLFGFAAVKGADGEARPVVWFKTGDYSMTTEIDWNDDFKAFSSFTDIKPGNSVAIADSKPIKIGEVLNVKKQGICEVGLNGAAGLITIHNTVADEFTCGVIRKCSLSDTPICIYALHGNNTVTIEPLNYLLLMFSTAPDEQQEIIEELYSGGTATQGALIDLSSAPDPIIAEYNQNKGWTGETWLTPVPSNANLVSYLIETSTDIPKLAKAGEAPSRTEISCVNKGLFVMKFKVAWTTAGGETGVSGWTDDYPIEQKRTICLDTLNIPNGAMVKPVVKAILGDTKEAPQQIQYFSHSTRLSELNSYEYIVSGTTLSVKCKLT